MAVRKTKEGANLKRWFKEKWVDVRTGKPFGHRNNIENLFISSFNRLYYN
jgi:hypothetical protein